MTNFRQICTENENEIKMKVTFSNTFLEIVPSIR